jgi:septum formation inhibitor-activating ATPase MinD
MSWPESEQKCIKKVPFSLNEALDALEKDSDFLTNSGVFSKDFISFWVKSLRKESNDILTASNQGKPAIHLEGTQVAGAYSDMIDRFLGADKPLRYLDHARGGYLQRLFGVR